MSGGLHKCKLSWDKDHKNRSVAVLAMIFLAAAGVVLLVYDGKQSLTELDRKLHRNSYGEGSRTEDIRIDVGREINKEPIKVEVTERLYTKNEINKVFKQSVAQMDRWILKENDSLDKVTSDMELITAVPNEPIKIEWELDRYDVMSVTGELIGEVPDEQGTPVKLSAVLTYTEEPDRQAMYECVAMVYPKKLSGTAKTIAEVKKSIGQKDAQTRTSAELKLPEAVQGKSIRYYKNMDMRGLVLIIMAVLITLLIFASEKQNKLKEEQKKRQQMLIDYPDLINKFTLLLGSGMTVKNVWRKMVRDYEEQKKCRGERYVYEEMKITLNEMQSGITEAESYERFGKRCGLQVYLKFGALLSQNLKKGTKGVSQLLKSDAIQAYEDRKARARRLGEEAGTKLLLPMFLMLSVVLVIVIVPAFMSMQM